MATDARRLMTDTVKLEDVQTGIRNAETALEMAELARQMGLPVDAQVEKATKTREQLLRIKQTLYPGQ